MHTAIFDAYNGIERRYTPIYVDSSAPRGASRRAAVIAAAYTALVGLFPSLSPLQRAALDASYAASLAALSDDGGDGGQSRERGIAWGSRWRQAVLAWRATDGFIRSLLCSVQRRTGGRPVAADGRVLRRDERAWGWHSPRRSLWPARSSSILDRREVWPASLIQTTSTASRRSVERRDRRAPTTRRRSRRSGRETPACTGTRRPTRLRAPHHLSLSDTNRLLAVLNIAMADTAFTIWNAKLFYGGDPLGGDLAAGYIDPAGRHRRQSGDGAGSRLDTARQHAVPPRVSCRPPRSEWSGGDRSPQPLR